MTENVIVLLEQLRKEIEERTGIKISKTRLTEIAAEMLFEKIEQHGVDYLVKSGLLSDCENEDNKT